MGPPGLDLSKPRLVNQPEESPLVSVCVSKRSELESDFCVYEVQESGLVTSGLLVAFQLLVITLSRINSSARGSKPRNPRV